MKLIQIHSVKATHEEDVFELSLSFEDVEGIESSGTYISRPSDPFGLNPEIRQWLEDHTGEYEIEAYIPPAEPTPEELRAKMPTLTARRLRIGIVRKGIALSAIDAAINAMPAGEARDEAFIEWEYATEYERSHPLIAIIGPVIGLSPEQVDEMWMESVNI